MRQLCACDLLLFACYIYRLQHINFHLKAFQRPQSILLVSSRGHNVVISSRAQQKPQCKLLGNQHVRIHLVPKIQYQPVYEGNEGQLKDHHYHPTTEEQTGNTYNFFPFVTSQTLQDQITVAALSNKHQTYTKLYRLLLTCCCFLSQ